MPSFGKRTYEYRAIDLTWPLPLEALNSLGRQGWKVVLRGHGYLLLERELAE